MAQLSEVKPGDLITAELMNQLLTEFTTLQTRVEELASQMTTPVMRLFRLEGPFPIRVGSRVTVVGQGFSQPSDRNSLSLDVVPVKKLISALSDDTKIVFDMLDPGLAGAARNVKLKVINAESQTDELSFWLEPVVQVPYGSLALNYELPPGGDILDKGEYDFGFRLTVQADRDVNVLLGADLGSAAGWQYRIVDSKGVEIKAPVKLTKASVLDYTIVVTVPDSGTAETSFNITATETTAGTHVTPAPPLSYTLRRGDKVPTPETRVIAKLESTSSAVTLTGSGAQFTKGTPGRLDFLFVFNLGTGVTGSTAVAWTFTLDPNTSADWTKGSPSTTGGTIFGATGTGGSKIYFTPGPNAARTTLLVNITAAPAGDNPIDVKYLIPLLV